MEFQEYKLLELQFKATKWKIQLFITPHCAIKSLSKVIPVWVRRNWPFLLGCADDLGFL